MGMARFQPSGSSKELIPQLIDEFEHIGISESCETTEGEIRVKEEGVSKTHTTISYPSQTLMASLTRGDSCWWRNSSEEYCLSSESIYGSY